jgi:1-acyl-sn-glycerol-3-phosphate acyltransferase
MSFLASRVRDLSMRSRADSIDDFGLDPVAADRTRPLLDFLYNRYFRVETTGLSHLPDRGRALIIANHSGFLPYDGVMLMHAVHRDHPGHRAVRPLVEDFVFHFPYLGTLLNRIGAVRACQENAERLLEREQVVAVFPEGGKGTGKLYSERYQTQRFGRGGFVKLALRTGAPIIPAAIVGAEEVQPMLGRVTWLARALGVPYLPITPTFPWLGPLGLLPFPSKWRIAFGAPIHLDGDPGLSAGRAEDRILVTEIAEQVRNRIQDMMNDLLGQRRSVI